MAAHGMEQPGKIKGVCKTGPVSDFRDGQIGSGNQQCSCIFKPQIVHIFQQGRPCILAEKFADVIYVQASDFGNLFAGDLFQIMMVDVVQDPGNGIGITARRFLRGIFRACLRIDPADLCKKHHEKGLAQIEVSVFLLFQFLIHLGETGADHRILNGRKSYFIDIRFACRLRENVVEPLIFLQHTQFFRREE